MQPTTNKQNKPKNSQSLIRILTSIYIYIWSMYWFWKTISSISTNAGMETDTSLAWLALFWPIGVGFTLMFALIYSKKNLISALVCTVYALLLFFGLPLLTRNASDGFPQTQAAFSELTQGLLVALIPVAGFWVYEAYSYFKKS